MSYQSHVKDADGYDDIIFAYTADQALEDGILADVTEMGHEAGFPTSLKVRVTRSVYDACTPPESNKIESFDGRMWDVLSLAINAVRCTTSESMTQFTVKIGRKNVNLYAALDTTSEPAVHIMFPEDY
jgi:hypothetical protein